MKHIIRSMYNCTLPIFVFGNFITIIIIQYIFRLPFKVRFFYFSQSTKIYRNAKRDVRTPLFLSSKKIRFKRSLRKLILCSKTRVWNIHFRKIFRINYCA